MIEEDYCCGKALAERLNEILKDKFYLDQAFDSLPHARRAAKNAIKLYNEIRLHLSLGFKTPNHVHQNAA